MFWGFQQTLLTKDNFISIHSCPWPSYILVCASHLHCKPTHTSTYTANPETTCIIFQPFSLTCWMLNAHLMPLPSYLPVLVSTIRALARHLKEDSTAPTATASEGSRVITVERLSSSNSCRWNVAASASRAIWQRHPVEGGGRVKQSYCQPLRQREMQRHTWTRMFMLVLYCSKALEQSFKYLSFCHLNNYYIINKLEWLTLWCASSVKFFFLFQWNVLYFSLMIFFIYLISCIFGVFYCTKLYLRRIYNPFIQT